MNGHGLASERGLVKDGASFDEGAVGDTRASLDHDHVPRDQVVRNDPFEAASTGLERAAQYLHGRAGGRGDEGVEKLKVAVGAVADAEATRGPNKHIHDAHVPVVEVLLGRKNGGNMIWCRACGKVTKAGDVRQKGTNDKYTSEVARVRIYLNMPKIMFKTAAAHHPCPGHEKLVGVERLVEFFPDNGQRIWLLKSNYVGANARSKCCCCTLSQTLRCCHHSGLGRYRRKHRNKGVGGFVEDELVEIEGDEALAFRVQGDRANNDPAFDADGKVIVRKEG